MPKKLFDVDRQYFPLDLKNKIEEGNSVAFIKFAPRKFTTLTKNYNPDTRELNPKETISANIEKGISGELQTKLSAVKGYNNIYLPIRPVIDTLKANYKSVAGLELLDHKDYMSYAGHLVSSGKVNEMLAKLPMIGKYVGMMNSMATSLAPAEFWRQGLLGSGYALNPNDLVIYTGTDRRHFSMEYAFLMPSSHEEEVALNDIIEMFKKGTIGEHKNMGLEDPIHWFVDFFSLTDTLHDGSHIDNGSSKDTGQNPYLSYFNCVLQNVSIKYGKDNDVYRTPTGMPVRTIKLDFYETIRPGSVTYNHLIKVRDKNGNNNYITGAESIYAGLQIT